MTLTETLSAEVAAFFISHSFTSLLFAWPRILYLSRSNTLFMLSPIVPQRPRRNLSLCGFVAEQLARFFRGLNNVLELYT